MATAGRQTVAPGEIVASDWGNTAWDHTIQCFSTAADRDLQFPIPHEGAKCFVLDVATWFAFQSGAWRVDTLGSTWKAYTPVLAGFTGGGAGAFLAASYKVISSTCFVRFRYTAGAGATFTGSTLFMSLPIVAVGGGLYVAGAPLGVGYLLDASVGSASRTGAIVCLDTTNRVFLISTKDANATVGQLAPWTWADNDVIMWEASYEIA